MNSDQGTAAYQTYQDALTENYEVFKEAWSASWEALRTQQADEIEARILFYTNREQLREVAAADSSGWLDGPRGEAEIALAGAIRAETITLATAIAAADINYAAETAGTNTTYDNDLVTLNAAHDKTVKTAELYRTVALDGVNWTLREAEDTAEGIYETTLYEEHAADLAAEALATGTPLAAYQAAIAAADAVLADKLATARDKYQDGLSIVSDLASIH